MGKVNHKVFAMYCDHLRSSFNVKGILIYSEKACQKLMIAGWPHARISALNDNEAQP